MRHLFAVIRHTPSKCEQINNNTKSQMEPRVFRCRFLNKTVETAMAVSLMACALLYADPIPKVPVKIDFEAQDRYGSILSFKVKEAINASSSMEIALDQDTAIALDAVMVTMEDSEIETNGTFYSLTINNDYPKKINGIWYRDRLYQTSLVGVCGKDVMQTCVDEILGKLSERASTLAPVINALSSAGVH